MDYANRVPEIPLVLVGEGDIEAPRGVKVLHGLTEAQLGVCYRRALVTCQPSSRESFSQVLFESWLQGTPVLVNEHCAVTRDFCLQANGGLTFRDGAGFKRAVEYFRDHHQERKILGMQGKEFTETRFHPRVIAPRYQIFLSYFPNLSKIYGLPVCLYNANFLKGDGVGNHLANQARCLQKWGSDFRICVEEKVEYQELGVETQVGEPENFKAKLHIFHYPGYYPLLKALARVRGQAITVFDYHGVTPSRFWPDDSLVQSERQVSLARDADFVFVHSSHLEEQLIRLHSDSPEKIIRFPYGVNLDYFRPGPPDPGFMRLYGLERGKVLLYVGRMGPNKGIDILVQGLVNLEPMVKLLLVGDDRRLIYAEVAAQAQEVARRLGVADRVIFTGKVSDEQLRRLYHCADLFVSASLHEGFGLPFVEAMACGIPSIGSKRHRPPGNYRISWSNLSPLR